MAVRVRFLNAMGPCHWIGKDITQSLPLTHTHRETPQQCRELVRKHQELRTRLSVARNEEAPSSSVLPIAAMCAPIMCAGFGHVEPHVFNTPTISNVFKRFLSFRIAHYTLDLLAPTAIRWTVPCAGRACEASRVMPGGTAATSQGDQPRS